jgi:hypothetical protein
MAEEVIRGDWLEPTNVFRWDWVRPLGSGEAKFARAERIRP